MPARKKRGDKPSVVKARKGRATAVTPKTLKVKGKKKPTTKKPKKAVAKKRAPKKGIKAAVTKEAGSSVSLKVEKSESARARKHDSGSVGPHPMLRVLRRALVRHRSVIASHTPKSVSDSVRSEMHLARRDFVRAGAFLTLLIGLLMGGYAFKAIAATFEGPTELPPGGNIPVTIWNRQSSGIKQDNAAIDVDGELSVGAGDLDLAGGGLAKNIIYGASHFYDYVTGLYYMDADDNLLKLESYYTNHPTLGNYYSTRFYINRSGSAWAAGSVTGATGVYSSSPSRQLVSTDTGQYVYYGAARYDVSNPAALYSHPKGDYLLWLQTRDYVAAGQPYADRFSVNVSGDVYASGCFGPVFIGRTAASYAPGDVSGYYGANNKCKTDYPSYPGVHVCTSEEMLESIKCSVTGDPIRAVADGVAAWVNGGPPGFTANANDCQGWTSSASNAYGRYWIFNLASGGRGTTTSCNSPGIPFACCK